MAAAPEDGLDIAVGTGEGLGVFHIVADARVALEIGLDIGLGLALRNVELARQPESADAVYDAKIDCLGASARERIHALLLDTEDLCSGHGVDIGACLKSVDQCIDACDMG